MSVPKDSDICGGCGVVFWKHELESVRLDKAGQRRCPPAHFRPLELPPDEPLESTPSTKVVQHFIDKASKRAKGLEALQAALSHWELYVAEQMAAVGRPKGEMEELIQHDRAALNELLRGVL